jgi:autoinducer 2-degrading protein
MLVVHVHGHVKSGFIETFKEATVENARNSVQEAGIARFDVIQQKDDANRFVLVEVYRTAADPARHKETAHYAKWRDTVAVPRLRAGSLAPRCGCTPAPQSGAAPGVQVATQMAEPHSSFKYDNIVPDDEEWE